MGKFAGHSKGDVTKVGDQSTSQKRCAGRKLLQAIYIDGQVRIVIEVEYRSIYHLRKIK